MVFAEQQFDMQYQPLRPFANMIFFLGLVATLPKALTGLNRITKDGRFYSNSKAALQG